MRDEWQTVKLVDACEVYQPKTISKKEMLPDGEFVVFGANGIIGRYDKFNHEEPQVLVTCRGATCGSINVSEPYAWITGNAMVIRPKADDFSKRYLEYYLRGAVDFTTVITGAAQPQITRQSLALVDFSFPLLSEQERIVAILDKAFEGIDQAIAHTEQNLASARELFESYLNKIFTQRGDGWVEKKLGDVCDFLNGFAFKSADTVTESDVQLIRMGNLYQNVLDLDRKPAFYPSRFKDDHSRYLLSEGDFIISLTGTVDKEDYGYTVEIPDCSHSLLLNQRIAKFTNFSDDIYKRFLLYFLRSRVFLDELYASARGVRQANLSTVTMKELSVFFPDVDSQRKLVGKFDYLRAQTYQLIALYSQKCKSLKELKQSLLQQAFAGELTKEAVA